MTEVGRGVRCMGRKGRRVSICVRERAFAIRVIKWVDGGGGNGIERDVMDSGGDFSFNF